MITTSTIQFFKSHIFAKKEIHSQYETTTKHSKFRKFHKRSLPQAKLKGLNVYHIQAEPVMVLL